MKNLRRYCSFVSTMT